jgi:hypothetical protein
VTWHPYASSGVNAQPVSLVSCNPHWGISPPSQATTAQLPKMRPQFLKSQVRCANPGPDLELGQPPRNFINGFPSAAAFIASDPDHSFSIYNAFHRLSSRNLLYLEAEILELQKQQDDLDFRDSRRDPDVQQCFRSWTKLRASEDPDQVKRMELIEKIREKLKEYRKSPESHAYCFST